MSSSGNVSCQRWTMLRRSTSAPRPRSARWASPGEGYRLAITMLRQLEASPELCDACALERTQDGENDAARQDRLPLPSEAQNVFTGH